MEFAVTTVIGYFTIPQHRDDPFRNQPELPDLFANRTLDQDHAKRSFNRPRRVLQNRVRICVPIGESYILATSQAVENQNLTKEVCMKSLNAAALAVSYA